MLKSHVALELQLLAAGALVLLIYGDAARGVARSQNGVQGSMPWFAL